MTARTRCRGCQRLTHVAEMLYVLLAGGDFAWRCARCVEDARDTGKKVSTA